MATNDSDFQHETDVDSLQGAFGGGQNNEQISVTRLMQMMIAENRR